MNLGIIGPLDSSEKIADVILNNFKDIDTKIYVVSKIEDAYLEVKKATKTCDGLIFTGLGVYSKVIEKTNINMPNIYIPFLNSSIIKVLWDLKKNYPEANNFSIDIVNSNDVYETLDDLNLKDLNPYIMPYNHIYPESRYLDFHINLVDNKKVNVCITGLGWVYENLKKNGYKVLRLYSTKTDIKNKIQELINAIDSKELKKSNLCIQLLNINKRNEIDHYENLEINSFVESQLVGYLKDIQASIFNIGNNQYIIFSTIGAVENIDNLKKLKDITSYLFEKSISINVGVGIGSTVYESEINARKALDLSIKGQKPSIYKVDNKKIEGPLLEEVNLEFSYVIEEDRLNYLSSKLDLNPLYIEKINSLIKIHSKKTFTSDELAKYLSVSVRTGSRIMKKILDSNCGKIIGIESNSSVGRPKNIVEINFEEV